MRTVDAYQQDEAHYNLIPTISKYPTVLRTSHEVVATICRIKIKVRKDRSRQNKSCPKSKALKHQVKIFARMRPEMFPHFIIHKSFHKAYNTNVLGDRLNVNVISGKKSSS